MVYISFLDVGNHPGTLAVSIFHECPAVQALMLKSEASGREVNGASDLKR